MIYLFEAGSTKTTLHTLKDGKVESKIFSGYNPNRANGIFETELSEISIELSDKVYFYGSGLASDQNKRIVKELFFNLFKITPLVFDDLLGAGRAAYGNQSGVVAIMGTGGIVAYYNGESIEDRRGGYGFLIDDLGGGYELGKRILSAWLNNDLDAESDSEIADFLAISKEDFIADYYINKDLLIVSEIPRLLGKVDRSVLNSIIEKYFEDFIESHVKSLLSLTELKKLSIIGGLAKNYEKLLQKVAKRLGVEIEQVISQPGLDLLDFHRN